MTGNDEPSYRVVVISVVLPVVEPLVAFLRELRHEPVTWLNHENEATTTSVGGRHRSDGDFSLYDPSSGTPRNIPAVPSWR